MFGLFYSLFMGTGLAVNEIKKTADEVKTINESNATDKIVHSNSGQAYYQGQSVRRADRNGHDVLVNRNGIVVKDFTREKEMMEERIDKELFDATVEQCKKERKKYFNYFCYSRIPESNFAKHHPSDFYDIDTKTPFFLGFDKKTNQYYKAPYYYDNVQSSFEVNWETKDRIIMTRDEFISIENDCTWLDKKVKSDLISKIRFGK